MTPIGFPHSDIHGSKHASCSPWRFAGCCVLLRLSVPRHPPCALSNLPCCVRPGTSHAPVLHFFVSDTYLTRSCVSSFLFLCLISALTRHDSSAMNRFLVTTPDRSIKSLLVYGINLFCYQRTNCSNVGRSGLEPPASRLSGVCSNQLSYRPMCNDGVRLQRTLWCSLKTGSSVTTDVTVD